MNLVIYYSKSFILDEDFSLFGGTEKLGTYLHLFQQLEANGFSTYIASLSDYVGERNFVPSLKFSDGKFLPGKETVRADVLLDKSKGSHTPPEELIPITFNCLEFKKIASNKDRTALLFPEYVPSSEYAPNKEALQGLLALRPSEALLVIKPVNGIRGRGIFIDSSEKLLSSLPESGYPYLLQTFVDTSKGIPGITKTYHDIRFIVANGGIIMAALRTPPAGSLLANVALGGSIEEIDLSRIPENILVVATDIATRLEHLFPWQCYSIDFGIHNQEKPYLFEINDRIGYPRDTMPSSKKFAEALCQSLLHFYHAILNA